MVIMMISTMMTGSVTIDNVIINDNNDNNDIDNMMKDLFLLSNYQ